VTVAVVSILFASGTGLVRAASTTLPGDQLYPVKRTWEDVLVLFAFNNQQRDALEVEHENERLHELQELFAEKRSAEVEFAGLVTSQNGNQWMVSGIPVTISAQTIVAAQDIVVGSAIQVKGQTQSDGAVAAQQIDLLPPGAKLPDPDDKSGSEEEKDEGETQLELDSASKGSAVETPNGSDNERPGLQSEEKSGSQDGTSGGDYGGSGDGSHDGSHEGSGDSGEHSGGEGDH
jgi:hypothetical protein